MSNLRNLPLKGLIVLVILFSVNLLAGRVFHRWDLTENREYTLSRATRNVLDRLDDVINIQVYFSRDLPSYFATVDRQVKDLLDEYTAHAGDMVRVDFIDPASDPALEQSLRMMGIPKIQVTGYERERAEVMNAYLGIAVQFEDKTEAIPVVQNIDRLEYDLTSAVIKVSSEMKTVGIATSGGAAVPEGYQGAQEVLRQQYQVRAVDISAGPVPDDVNTLVVADNDAFGEQALYHIDRFVMQGGRVLFLAGGVDVNLASLAARDREVKVGSLLRTYGVAVQPAMVVDAQAPMVGFDVGAFLPISIRYPWFPQIIDSGLSQENPITSEMQSLIMPWTSPLELLASGAEDAGEDGEGAAPAPGVEVLARSSERSFAARAPYDLNPQSRLQPPGEGFASQVTAVAMTGSFPSHWAGGRPVPGDSLGTVTPGPDRSPETQIVVVGGANFVQDRFLQQFPSNSVFLANTVDWMTLGNDLISIRSRGGTTRPLKEIEEEKRGLLKALAIFPVPALVVLFGLVRARFRRARRARHVAEFGGGA